jgi:hypothetical protein
MNWEGSVMTINRQSVDMVLQVRVCGHVVLMRKGAGPLSLGTLDKPIQAWRTEEFAELRECIQTGATHTGVTSFGGGVLLGLPRHTRAGDRIELTAEQWAAVRDAFRAGEFDAGRLTGAEPASLSGGPVIVAQNGSEAVGP